MKEGGTPRGASRPSGGGRAEGARMTSLARVETKTATRSIITRNPEGGRTAFVYGKDGKRRSVTADKFSAFPQYKMTGLRKVEGPKTNVSVSKKEFDSRFQSFPAVKHGSESGGTYQRRTADEIRSILNQPQNAEQAAEKSPVSLIKADKQHHEKKATFIAPTVRGMSRDRMLPPRPQEMLKSKKSVQSEQSAGQKVSLEKQTPENRIFSTKIRSVLLDTGVVNNLAEADQRIQNYWIDNHPTETTKIIPKETQQIPRITESESYKIARLQAELQQLAQAKSEGTNTVIKKLGIDIATQETPQMGLQTVPNAESKSQEQIGVSTAMNTDSQNEIDMAAYLLLEKKKKKQKMKGVSFVVDRMARVGRYNLILGISSGTNNFFSSLINGFKQREIFTGADIAKEMPVTAPPAAVSKLAQEMGSGHDGSYLEFRELMMRMSPKKSAGEVLSYAEKVNAEVPPVERINQKGFTEVGMKDVLRVLLGQGLKEDSKPGLGV